jgi:hypothetical protein
MSGQPTPTLISTPFAQSATNINVIPITTSSPGFASWLLGWQPINETELGAGGIAPKCEDFNGVLNAVSQSVAAWQAGQGMPYSADLAVAIGGYNKGAILFNAAQNGYWMSTANGNTNNPDTTNPSTNNWVLYAGIGTANVALTGSNVTLSATQAANPQIYFTGTLTGNVIVTFPNWLQNWWVNNDTAVGPYTITVASYGGGNSILIPFGGTYIYGDGTNMGYASQVRGSFTAVYQGGTTEPTGTAAYSRNGNLVTVTLPIISPLASNSTSFSAAGLPAQLVPAGIAQYAALAGAQDNSAAVTYQAFAYPYSNSGTPTLAFGLKNILAGWTASGNKQVLGTFTYDLFAGV